MFDTCEQKYGELTCKIRRYVEEGIPPYVPCDGHTLQEICVAEPAKEPLKPRSRFAAILFFLNVLTLGLLHFNYR